MPKELKKEQIDAINLEKDLILSANAGSGKTFVMLERVIHFIVDKEQSVLDFLLITFTDAAANQMLSKLQRELLKKYHNKQTTEKQKNHIKEELSKISVADISTIHTFCYKLIKKYFYVAGVGANVSICDEDMSSALKEKAMEQTLTQYAGAKNEHFLSLMQTYDNKRNFSIIREIVMKIFNYLSNQVNKDEFEKKIEKVYDDYEETSITNIINSYVVEVFEYFTQKMQEVMIEAKELGCESIVWCAESVVSKTSQITKENSFRENHGLIFNKMSGFLSKPKKVDDNHIEVSEKYASIKADLTKEIKYIKEKIYLNKDISSLKQDLLWCKNNVLSLLQIEKTFESKYNELKLKKSLLDFSDLEHLAYKILCDKKVQSEVKKSYKQIFVDEYQDVNDIQEAIIQKLDDEERTVFLVGDPKQSIYRFRNTNPQIMLSKLEKFENSNSKQAIPLTYNFRSDKNILNFSNFVFSQIMTKQSTSINYEKDGMFECGLNYPKSKLSNVEMCVIPYEKDGEEKVVPNEVYSVKNAQIKKEQDNIYAKTEAEFVVSKISKLMKEGTEIYDPDHKENNGMRKVKWSDIAILYRSRGAYLDAILSHLKKFNIPLKAVSSENVLEKIEVQTLLNFLKLLVNTQDDYALVGFLTSVMIDMNFDELAKLREKGKENFFELLKQNKDENKKLKKAFELICEGREKLLNGTIYSVLTWLCEETKYQSLLLSFDDGEEKVLNVNSYINDFLSHSYNSDLISYLSYIEENDKASVAQLGGGEEDAVSVITMHHSKGLEFPICFVVDMAHEFNKADLSGPALFSTELGIGVQKFDKESRYRCSTIARSAIILDEGEKSFAEELRVLYVGLTRAKNHLYISGKAKLDKQKHDTSFYHIKHKKDYMSIILSCLKDVELNAMQNGKTILNIKTGDDSHFKLSVIKPICVEEENKDVLKKGLFDVDFKEIFSNIQRNEALIEKQKEVCNIAYKSSVSRIMEKEDAKTSHPQNIQKLFVSEDGVSASEIGLAYHKAMQIIPLDLTDKNAVEKFLQENLSYDELKLVSCDKITKCLNWLQPYLKGATKIIREGQFYLNIPYNKIIKTSHITDKILIQGVVDLVIVKNDEAILIDYKTNHEKNDDVMRKKYEIQLECYKIAVENAIKRAVSAQILYSFFKECEILFDK